MNFIEYKETFSLSSKYLIIIPLLVHSDKSQGRIFFPNKQLINEDFPEFEAPRIGINIRFELNIKFLSILKSSFNIAIKLP